MERGSVEGEVFHRGAVAVLSPDRSACAGGAPRHARPQGAHPLDIADFPDDEGFRFRHLLIRDAAYESHAQGNSSRAPRALRRLAVDARSVEGDEIVGYHLEQAHRYRAELDTADPALVACLARVRPLASAGRAAMDRGDFNAGRSLFRRATTILTEDDPKRLALTPDLA